MNTWGPEDWKPISTPEGRYCSPACGRGCSLSEYDRAHEDGIALATRLGAGWTYRVWENLGWHYSVVSPCGRIKIHGHGESYSAFLGEPESGGGKWVESAASPEAAVRAVIAVAKAELAKMEAVFVDLSYCGDPASSP